MPETLEAEPNSEDAESLRRWIGGPFDPEMFDQRAAKAAILRMPWSRWGGQ